jgi:hypothetical protein
VEVEIRVEFRVGVRVGVGVNVGVGGNVGVVCSSSNLEKLRHRHRHTLFVLPRWEPHAC